MTTQAQLRNRYLRENVATASPAQLVVMLYDRMLKDLTTAEMALAQGDIAATHEALVHAQDILHELNATLDTSVWKEGEALQRLYVYCIDQLMDANMRKSSEPIGTVRSVLEPIADAWRQVASGATGDE